MALTPLELINDAVGLAFPFVREDMISRGMLLRHVQVMERDVVTFLAMHKPELIDAVGTDITIVAASNQAGYTLPANLWVGNFFYMEPSGNSFKLRIVPENQYDDPPEHPAAIIRGVTLLPCDPEGLRWAGTDQRDLFTGNGDKIKFSYIAPLAVITSLTATLKSPEEVRNYLLLNLVLDILLVSGMATPDRLQAAVGAVQAADYRLILLKKFPTDSSIPSSPSER